MRTVMVAIAAMGLATSAQAVTIINGSFETGTFDTAGFDTLAAADTSITGWTIGGAGIDWIGSYWTASNGDRSIDLSATDTGSLSQTIATDVGKTYVVSFDLAGNPFGDPQLKQLDVSINGGPVTTYDFTTNGTTDFVNMGWVGRTYRFTATSTSSTLTFTSLSASSSGPALDNVAISTVPEPASWAMMLAGAGLVGLAVRRRRPAVAA